MSFDNFLNHLCTIKRPTETQVNAHGLGHDRLMVIVTDQPCRLIARTQATRTTQSAEEPIVTSYVLLLPRNANIAEHDHISAVALDDGTVMTGGWTVKSILPRNARSLRHISCQLERVQ